MCCQDHKADLSKHVRANIHMCDRKESTDPTPQTPSFKWQNGDQNGQ